MLRKEIYDSITTTFENNYTWLGRQFAEELLLSIASQNIQKFSKPPFRIRRHLLLFWGHGWLKSKLLEQAYEILGTEKCVMMSDISNAALRGTVEHGQFISPYVLKRPFSVCTEFGQITSGSDSVEIIQKLLNVLEEGIVTVSLGKIGDLGPTERQQAKEEFGITFIDRNTFTYKTDWVMLAGTYNKKFLVDNAFESRFSVITPEKKLDNELARYVVTHKHEEFNEDAVYNLRGAIGETYELDLKDSKLPDQVFDGNSNLTMRICSQLLSYRLCRAWWGIKTEDEDIIRMSRLISERTETVWKTADDRVFDCIEMEPKTSQCIADELNISRRQVYYSLRKIRATRRLDGDEIRWCIS